MPNKSQLQIQLMQAQEAYHNLMCGQSVVEFRDSNGETVKYNQASAPRLLAYIQSLRAQLGLNAIGPARVWF